MTDLKFLTERDKVKVGVAIPKIELTKHKGISGLKYYLIVAYLRKHLQAFGEVSLSLHHLAVECGYSTKTHNPSAYNDFRKILKGNILDKELATTDVDILTIGAKTQFSIRLSEMKNLFYGGDNYVLFTIDEFEKIVSDSSKVNNSVLSGVYLYIKQHILMSSDMNVYFAKLAYPSKHSIMRGIGLSSTTTIESAIKSLVNLNLLYMRNDLYVEDKNNQGVYVPARCIFALDEKELELSVCIGELSAFYGRNVILKTDVPKEQRKFI